MGFVDDDEVEVAHAEAFDSFAPGFVDAVHHGRVGGEDDAALVLFFFFQEVDRGGVGVAFVETAFGLGDQGDAVGKEQDAARPVGLHEEFDQGDGKLGFAGSCGHDHEGFASFSGKVFGDSANTFVVVFAANDGRIDGDGFEGFSVGAAVDEELKFVCGIESLDQSRRVVGVVPYPCFVAVGIEDNRALACFLFQAVGIEFGLVLPFAGIFFRSFGFDQGKGEVVGAPQDVIDDSGLAFIGHAVDLIFD